jgi:uncharacterized protein YhaN
MFDYKMYVELGNTMLDKIKEAGAAITAAEAEMAVVDTELAEAVTKKEQVDALVRQINAKKAELRALIAAKKQAEREAEEEFIRTVLIPANRALSKEGNPNKGADGKFTPSGADSTGGAPDGETWADFCKDIGKYRYNAEWQEGVVPVVLGSYTDDDMIGLFTGDNFDRRGSVSALLETIAVNRKRIIEILQESETIEYFNTHFSEISEKCQKAGILKTQKALDTARGKRGGMPLLRVYLGKNFEKILSWHIDEALAALNAIEAGRLSKKAYLKFDDLALAKAFRQKMTSGNGDKPLVAPTRQPRVAKKIVKQRTKTAETRAKVEAQYDEDVEKAKAEKKPAPKKPTMLVTGRVPARTTVDEVVDDYVDEEQDEPVEHPEVTVDPVLELLAALGKRFDNAEQYLTYAADECRALTKFIKKEKLDLMEADVVKVKKWHTLLTSLDEAVKGVLVYFVKAKNTKHLT